MFQECLKKFQKDNSSRMDTLEKMQNFQTYCWPARNCNKVSSYMLELQTKIGQIRCMHTLFYIGYINWNKIAQRQTQLKHLLSSAKCPAVWGSIIIHHPTTTLLSTLLLAIAIYSPDQQKKINYSAPIRDIELKFWG